MSLEIANGNLCLMVSTFDELHCEAAAPRATARKSLVYKVNDVHPSSIEEHSALILIVCKGLQHPVVSMLLQGQSRAVWIDLYSIIRCSIGLRRTKLGQHSLDFLPRPEYTSKVLITTVSEPRASGTMSTMVLVESNLEVQFLCCEPVLQKDAVAAGEAQQKQVILTVYQSLRYLFLA